jgi:hypothetical protein
VVLAGTGTVEETDIGKLAAVEADPGEKVRYTATEELVLFTIGLPPIQLPVEPDDDKFVTVLTDGGIRFENAKDADNG